ncbi:MAG: Gfo/Idh/MocA family oxidoreductase [Thermomicrobiales bacterium]
MPRTYRIAGISFDHVHMPDLLRMVAATPNAELVGVFDEDRSRMAAVAAELSIPVDRIFTDFRECMETAKPDVAIICAATGRHGEWAERLTEYGAHLFVEKPFAAALDEADRIIEAAESAGVRLMVNWPQRWNAVYVTAKRLVDAGLIGDVTEVHYYGGNRGPVTMVTDTAGMTDEQLLEAKRASWFYRRESGGGSLLDYLGYGVTMGTWYMDGRKPVEVSCTVDVPEGIDVDEQSVTICRYATGLSTFQTRWGTLTNPWETQPQPKAGYTIVGRDGTLSAYSGDSVVRVQTRQRPQIHELQVEPLGFPERNPIEYLLDRLDTGQEIDGPVSPAISRVGQQITDSAILSAREKRMVGLVGEV